MTHLGEHLVTFLNGKHDFISAVLNPLFLFLFLLFSLLTESGDEPHASWRCLSSGIAGQGSPRKPFKLTRWRLWTPELTGSTLPEQINIFFLNSCETETMSKVTSDIWR